MKVKDLMSKNVGCCYLEDSLNRAAQIMWERDCGVVPVMDRESRVVGLLTDRDVCMAAFTQGRPLKEIPTSIAMSKEVWSCRPEDDLGTAAAMMRTHQIHRLPVTDERGKALGILSLGDVAREAAKQEKAKGRKEIHYSDVGSTVGAISEPRLRAADPVPVGALKNRTPAGATFTVQ